MLEEQSPQNIFGAGFPVIPENALRPNVWRLNYFYVSGGELH